MRRLERAGRGLVASLGIAAAGYAALVAWNRWRYGAPDRPSTGGSGLIDRFIPEPEVAERHHIAIEAPPEVVLTAAKELRLLDSPVIRAIFRLRELALGGEPDRRPHPEGLLEQMRSIGWVILAETAGREVVFGAVTRPWEAAPVFRSIPASAFAAFAEPGYVKIVWTLAVEPAGDQRSIFRTETRVATTDAASRERFRRYWSFVAPGVELIRLVMLRPLKREAERRAARRTAA